MELKLASIITPFLLFLLISTPCFTKDLDTGIYDIDYRGPETHSNLPPPNRTIHRPAVRQESTVKYHRKWKGLRARHVEKGKKTQG